MFRHFSFLFVCLFFSVCFFDRFCSDVYLYFVLFLFMFVPFSIKVTYVSVFLSLNSGGGTAIVGEEKSISVSFSSGVTGGGISVKSVMKVR